MNRDFAQARPMLANTQNLARAVLSSWVCGHEYVCDCYAYQKLLERAANGLPLYPKQIDTLYQLLQRGDK